MEWQDQEVITQSQCDLIIFPVTVLMMVTTVAFQKIVIFDFSGIDIYI